MAQGDLVFNPVGGLFPVAGADPLQTYQHGKQIAEAGALHWTRDAFGKSRIYQLRRNLSGSAFAAGELVSKKLALVDDITSGSTTSATKAGAFGTSPLYVGALVIVRDDAGGAGAAPEGEFTVVKSHDANTLTFDPNLPLSTALAANDDLTILSIHAVDAADNDPDYVVIGLAMTSVADGDWGWFQCAGVHPAAVHKAAAAVTAGNPIVADAATVGPHGTDPANLWVGRQLTTHAADVASAKSPVVMTLLPAFV